MHKPLSPRSIPVTPEIPFDPSVNTYTRFTVSFEPYEYTGWVDECISWKRTCYVGDWSPLSNKHLVKGPDALKFFSDIAVNSFAKFDVGQAKHIVLCSRLGNVMCEGVLMRRADDELLFTCGPTYWTEYLFAKGNYNATSTQLGLSQFIIQVQGPYSLYLLEEVTGDSLRDIGFMRFRQSRIGNMKFDVLRQGMSGELGYELHGRSEDGEQIHRSLLEAGKEFGVRRLGGRTKMINHVEACFPTPTVDYIPAAQDEPDYVSWCNQQDPAFLNRPTATSGSLVVDDIRTLYRNPVELGWAKNIKFDHEFIGREVIARALAEPRRAMVTLVWNSEDVMDIHASLFRQGEAYEPMELPRNLLGCMWADRVLHGEKLVGVSTSRCYSYHFRQMISLCTIDVAQSAPGTEVTVIWGRAGSAQKAVRATVARAPYKQDNRRIDVSALPARL